MNTYNQISNELAIAIQNSFTSCFYFGEKHYCGCYDHDQLFVKDTVETHSSSMVAVMWSFFVAQFRLLVEKSIKTVLVSSPLYPRCRHVSAPESSASKSYVLVLSSYWKNHWALVCRLL